MDTCCNSVLSVTYLKKHKYRNIKYNYWNVELLLLDNVIWENSEASIMQLWSII